MEACKGAEGVCAGAGVGVSGKISLKRGDLSCTGRDMRKHRKESLGHRMPRSSMGRGAAYRSEPGPFGDSGRFHCALFWAGPQAHGWCLH